MRFEIEKAIMFQNLLDKELESKIVSTINEYDKFERSLDKIEVDLPKFRCKAFCESKEDLRRYIDTCKDMPSPDINLLEIISNTFYSVNEDDGVYKISMSVEGLRCYIEKQIRIIARSDEFCKYDKLGENEEIFAKKLYERYLIKKYFKDLNDRGRIPVEFEIQDVVRYMVDDEKNTSYDKFSNLKKFKIDKMLPKLQKILGLHVDALTVNSGRNTDRLYMECVDRIDAKKYARQIREDYSMTISDAEKVIKDAIEVVENDKQLSIKVLGEGEYSITLGGIEFICVVSKIVNYKVDLMVKYTIKNKKHELIINEDILKQPVMYTSYGAKALEYYLFIIIAHIDETATLLSGMLIGKEFETGLIKTDYRDIRKEVGPILNNNGNADPYVLLKMSEDIIEEVNTRGEQLVKVNVSVDPMLRVNVATMLKEMGEKADEYLKEYDNADFGLVYEKGVPWVGQLEFVLNIERNESYVKIPGIKCIDFVTKEVKKEVKWDSNCVLEEEDILVIKDTEKEYLGMCVERYVHNNLAAISMRKDTESNISKDVLEKLKDYYNRLGYVDSEYLSDDLVSYIDLI